MNASSCFHLLLVITSVAQVFSMKAASNGSTPRQDLMRKVLSKSMFSRKTSSSTYDDLFSQDDDYDYSNIFFDISQFSVKFHSCANLLSFDFDDFQHEKSSKSETYPYTSTQVVNYRLCPTDSCQDSSWKGCKNVYGSHVITLEDYFEAKKDYEDYLKESLQEECEYCENCESFYKKYGEKCAYFDSCSNYDRDECNKYDKGRDDIDYSEYLECRRVDLKMSSTQKKKLEKKEKNEEKRKKQKEETKKKKEERRNKLIETYGYYKLIDDDDYYSEVYDDDYEDYLDTLEGWEKSGKVYLKVYCDGYLKIGIFSDDKCSKYIGDEVSIESVTDLKIDEDDLKYEFDDHDCISCQTESKYDEAETTKMCKNMYEDAVKCNVNIPVNYTSFDEQETNEWEETLSGSVCSTIEDIQKGNINAYGILTSSDFTRSPTTSPTSYPTSKSTSYNSGSSEEVTSSSLSMSKYYSETNSSKASNEDDESESLYYYNDEDLNEADDEEESSNVSGYYDGNDDTLVESESGDDMYNSSSSGNKSIKDYQTDFTNTINNKYMPDGHSFTEDEIMYIAGASLIALVAMVGLCVFQKREQKKEDDYVRSDLLKNSGGHLV